MLIDRLKAGEWSLFKSEKACKKMDEIVFKLVTKPATKLGIFAVKLNAQIKG